MPGSNKKTFTLLVMAIALGVAGALLAMLYLNARESELRALLKPKSQPVSVVVASRDLVKGDVLDANTLSVRQIPSDYVSDQAVRPDQFGAVEGKILQQNMAAGKPLLRSFIGDEFPLDFSDTIVIKRRAMTIQVDEINSFAGLLRPGNRIDLMVNIEGGSGGDKQVVPVLENVEVLSAGRETAYDYEEKVRILRGGVDVRPEQNYTTLTLNVTPREAALLTVAQEKGDILALLRNRNDIGGSGFTQVSTDSIEENAQLLAQRARVKESSARLTNNIVRGEDGLLRTADGTVLANQDLIIGEDGSIRTKSGIDLASRGLSINEKGEIITADGKVVDPNELIITADGTLMTADGTVLEGNKVAQLSNLTQRADGTVVSADGTIISGATLNDDGMLVLADGTVVNPDEIEIRADGTVVTKDGQVLAGLTASTTATASRAPEFSLVDYIVGGVSVDSVATVNKVPVAK